MYNYYMKNLLLIASISFIFLTFFKPVEARLLPRFQNAGRTGGGGAVGPYASARLRGDRLALIATFGNLQKANNVVYTLMYQTAGVDQGVSGSLDSSAGNTVTRELLFGTCSSGVCRYHGVITNMKLEVSFELPNGKHLIKRFRVRV